MTISNLPKDIIRKPSHWGQMLLAYLPVTRLTHVTNQLVCRRMLTKLFHACMRCVLEPLKTAGVDGVLMESGDGVVRRAHPILATFIGDYLEQVLVCCCKTGKCLKCIIECTEIGKSEDPSPLHDLDSILFTLGIHNLIGLPGGRYQASYPTLLAGLKHLIAWIKTIYGSTELDAQCRWLPPNHGVHLFINGISKLYQVSGKDHADICWILPGLIIGIPLWNGFLLQHLTCVVWALLDFLYLAQYISHAHIIDADTYSRCSEVVPWQQGHLCGTQSTITFEPSETTHSTAMLIRSSSLVQQITMIPNTWNSSTFILQRCLPCNQLQGWVPTDDAVVRTEGESPMTWSIYYLGISWLSLTRIINLAGSSSTCFCGSISPGIPFSYCQHPIC